MPTAEPRSRLDDLLRPRSVAVIGLSPDSAPSRHLLQGLRRVGYKGEIYGVNPSRSAALGAPCVPSIADLPGVPDLATILLPARRVPDALAELADRGCRAAHVLAAGADAETAVRLRAVANERSVAVLGPNCNGFVSANHDVHGWVGVLCRPYRPGALAIVGQSGAVLASGIHAAWDRGLGLSYVVSTGDEASVTTPEVLAYIADDPDSRVAIVYMETFERFATLADSIRRCHERNKPVIIIAPVNSEAARQVSVSHTGAITPAPLIAKAAIDGLGALHAASLDEALDYASLFAQLPRKHWRPIHNVGVVSASGGWAAIAAEHLADHGLELPPLPAAVTDVLPAQIPRINPIDVTAIRQVADALPHMVERMVRDPAFDAVCLLMGAWEGCEPWFAPVWTWTDRADKPVFLGGNEVLALSEGMRALFERNTTPFIQGVERIARGLWAMNAHCTRPGPAQHQPPPAALWAGGGVATVVDLEGPLAEYGVDLVRSTRVDEGPPPSGDYPRVLKLESAGLPHKTEAGAVRFPIRTPEEFVQARADLIELAGSLRLRDWCVISQPYVGESLELLIGAVVDDNVGPVLTLALGGVWAEVLDRKVHRLCPLNEAAAERMISALGIDPVLAGYRGKPALARAELVRMLTAAARFVTAHVAHLRELDINPVLLTAHACVAVDALAAFRTEGQAA